MQKIQFGKTILSLSALLLLGAGPLLAQSNQGSIAGNVLDSTGAAVPHAAIVAKNRETGYTSTAETSAAGSYRFPAVPLGSYDLSVKMAGFKAANYSGVLVQVNTVSSLDITLEVGSSSEQVTVE